MKTDPSHTAAQATWHALPEDIPSLDVVLKDLRRAFMRVAQSLRRHARPWGWNIRNSHSAHRFQRANVPLKLHLGCGPRHIPGFVHIDLQPAPHVDIVCPVEHLPFEDASVSMIYASHVLEHFGRHEYRAVLAEWMRVLEPGGVLRLAVPDFTACAAIYYEHGLQDGLSGLIGLIVGGQRNQYDYHKMVFDETYLRADLLGMGFKEVRRWHWQTSEHSAVDDYSQAYLPHLHKEDGRLMSLNLEAIK